MRVKAIPAPTCTVCFITNKGDELAVNTVRYTFTVSEDGEWSIRVIPARKRAALASGEDLREIGVCAAHDNVVGNKLADAYKIFADLDQMLITEADKIDSEHLEAARLEQEHITEGEPEDYGHSEADDDDQEESDDEGGSFGDDEPEEESDGFVSAPVEDVAAVMARVQQRPDLTRVPPAAFRPPTPPAAAPRPGARPVTAPTPVEAPAAAPTNSGRISNVKKGTDERKAMEAWHKRLTPGQRINWKIPTGPGQQSQEMLKTWKESDDYMAFRAEQEIAGK